MFSTLVQNENCRLDERKKMSQSAFRDRMNTDPLPARPQKNAPSSSPAEKPVYVTEETKNKEHHEMRDLSTSTHAYSGYDNVIFYKCILIIFLDLKVFIEDTGSVTNVGKRHFLIPRHIRKHRG